MFGEGQTMAIARTLWVGERASSGELQSDRMRNNNRITNSQSLLKNVCAVQATAVVTVTWP